MMHHRPEYGRAVGYARHNERCALFPAQMSRGKVFWSGILHADTHRPPLARMNDERSDMTKTPHIYRPRPDPGTGPAEPEMTWTHTFLQCGKSYSRDAST